MRENGFFLESRENGAVKLPKIPSNYPAVILKQHANSYQGGGAEMMGTVQQIGAEINGAQWFLLALAVLVVIAVIVKMISVLVRAPSRQQKDIPPQEAAGEQAAFADRVPAPMVQADRQKLLAGIAAALAEDMGVEVSRLRIHSLRPLAAPAAFPAPGTRQAVLAAISAAIAEDMGTEVSRLRIHGVRPLSAPTAARETANQGLLAAIAAALAEDMGTDVSHLRIHAVRRV